MDIMQSIPPDWREKISSYFTPEDAEGIEQALERRLEEGELIYPAQQNVFRALELTRYAEVKAVWLGQDPYHGPGQATGLAFAVPNGTKLPPSLKNIFKEYISDLNPVFAPADSSLEPWARHGVLLLNTVYTVREHAPMSHRGLGWEKLTCAILSAVADRSSPVAFMLMGNDARAYKALADNGRHVIFEAAHPSPLSAYRGFFGSRPFSTVNRLLLEKGAEVIDWSLD